MIVLLLVPTGGKQRFAAPVACDGDQWSLIFPKRLRLHFLGGRGIADPSTGRLSGSRKQGFLGLDATALLVCFAKLKAEPRRGRDGYVEHQRKKHEDNAESCFCCLFILVANVKKNMDAS